MREVGQVQFRRARAFLRSGDRAACDEALREVAATANEGYDEFLWPDARFAPDLLAYATSVDSAPIFKQLRGRGHTNAGGAEPPHRAVFDVTAMGQWAVRRIGDEQELAWRSTRSFEFLLLLLMGNPQLRKEDIALALWPEITPERLDSAFHSTLHRLRRSIGADHVQRRASRYGLADRDAFRCDVDDFRARIRRARALPRDASEREATLDAAAALYRGSFADGLDSDWIVVVRRELEREYLWALSELGRAALLRQDWQSAHWLASRIRSIDPDHETAAELDAGAHLGAGNAVAGELVLRDLEQQSGTALSPALRVLRRKLSATSPL